MMATVEGRRLSLSFAKPGLGVITHLCEAAQFPVFNRAFQGYGYERNCLYGGAQTGYQAFGTPKTLPWLQTEQPPAKEWLWLSN